MYIYTHMLHFLYIYTHIYIYIHRNAVQHPRPLKKEDHGTAATLRSSSKPGRCQRLHVAPKYIARAQWRHCNFTLGNMIVVLAFGNVPVQEEFLAVRTSFLFH